MKYSEQLIEQRIGYFTKKYDKKISRGEAIVYLDSFADLFLAVADKND